MQLDLSDMLVHMGKPGLSRQTDADMHAEISDCDALQAFLLVRLAFSTLCLASFLKVNNLNSLQFTPTLLIQDNWQGSGLL